MRDRCCDPARISHCREAFDSLCEEMEVFCTVIGVIFPQLMCTQAGAAAVVCRRFDVPFLAIKVADVQFTCKTAQLSCGPS